MSEFWRGYERVRIRSSLTSFDPRSHERGLQLPDRWTLEAHVGFPPGSIRPSIAKPFVVDAEASGPSDTTVDDDAPNVRAILCEMERREPDRPKRFDHDAPGSERVAIAYGHIDGPEGIVKNQNAHTRLSNADAICRPTRNQASDGARTARRRQFTPE